MTAFKPGDPTTLNRLYGRSIGKPLRGGQQKLVEELLPQIAVPEDGAVTADNLFGSDRPLHFEIGFGSGEHMADRADMLPDHGFIGAEPFLNGVAAALVHIEERRLPNIRLHHGDALEVLARIPDGALGFVYLLHPDPWPKARHAKRRMMNDGPVALIARQAETGRRVPLRHRPSRLSAPCDDGDAAPCRPAGMADRKPQQLGEAARRLERNAL